MPTSPRFYLPCRPAYQREATPHRRVVRHSFQCRPLDKAMPRAQKQVRHFQSGQEFCDFARRFVQYSAQEVSSRKASLIWWSSLSSLLFHASRVNFELQIFFFNFSVAARLYMYTIGQHMVSSKGQQDLPSGHQVLWWLSRYYFMDSEVIIFQLLFVWCRLASPCDDYLKSSVAEVIKCSCQLLGHRSWVSLR